MNAALSYLLTRWLKPMAANMRTTLAGIMILLVTGDQILNQAIVVTRFLLGMADGEAINYDDLRLAGMALFASIAALFSKDAKPANNG